MTKDKVELTASDVLNIFGKNSKIYGELLTFLKKQVGLNGLSSELFYYKLHRNNADLVYYHIYLQVILKFFYWKKFGFVPDFENLELAKIYLKEGDLLQIFEFIEANFFQFEDFEISQDIFIQLYEQLIEQQLRVQIGEYYTPSWLVKKILDYLSKIILDFETKQILDPACGSGNFLIYYAKLLKEKHFSTEKILKLIFGFDINPIAVLTAKINLSLLLNYQDLKAINIQVRDALAFNDLFLHNKRFDIIVGNPPWGVLRTLKDIDYQNFVKKVATKYNLLEPKNTHLFSQIEIATVFFYHSVKQYLKKDGIICFIMPKNVVNSQNQYTKFLNFQRIGAKLLEIWDLEKISNLFPTPSVVVFAKKTFYSDKIPLLKIFSPTAEDFSIKQVDFEFQKINKIENFYSEKFKVGLSFFPKSFYFVEIKSYNSKLFEYQTDKQVFKKSKNSWKYFLTGLIEKNFLFNTIQADDLCNFYVSKLSFVIAPIIVENNFFKLLGTSEIEKFPYLNQWFVKIQKLWISNATASSKKRFPTILDRLNYNNLIKAQSPTKKYAVIYNGTGKNIKSAVVEKSKTSFPLIFDVKTWFYETNDKAEAFYLAGILNSDYVNNFIKPFQPRGLGGERAIHRRPFYLFFPKFDVKSTLHNEIAFASENLSLKIKQLCFQDKCQTKKIKELFIEDFNFLDKLIRKLLENGNS